MKGKASCWGQCWQSGAYTVVATSARTTKGHWHIVSSGQYASKR
jgi:hypothetical protein